MAPNAHCEAYGIDRLLEKNENYLQQMDRLEPNTWGTIVSNMAFTNHLHYINYHNPIQLKPYLRKFKGIIESLKTGGSFTYAPGVPFIEDRLEARGYRVEDFEVVRGDPCNQNHEAHTDFVCKV